MNDLENRCLKFAISVRKFVKQCPKNIPNYEDGKQVVRSSGSIGANYFETNESLGDKDKVMHLKISRKEAKETIYWLTIMNETNPELTSTIEELLKEANELKNILSSIILKLEKQLSK
jgi:four helix bundle protein